MLTEGAHVYIGKPLNNQIEQSSLKHNHSLNLSKVYQKSQNNENYEAVLVSEMVIVSVVNSQTINVVSIVGC